MTDQRIDARSLRVSDAEREHVVALLQRATGSGLIDLDEFSRRVDTALAARTRAELNVVLLDLPGLTHPDQGAVPARRPAQRVAATPAGDTGGPVVRSVFSSVVRRGDWDVPARLVVHVAMGSAELDFTEAQIPHDLVEIELDVVAGSLEMRIPSGSRVEHDQVSVMLSSVEDKRRSDADAPAGPTFVLSGSVRASSVEIKSPHRMRWWRAQH